MFTKGYIPWNKKFYPEKLKKLCECGCGKLTSGKSDHGKTPEYVRGHFTKGKKISYRSRYSMRGRNAWNKGLKGRQQWMNTDGLKLGRGNYRKYIGLKGEMNPNWRGGITPERVKIWKTPKYANWRIGVFKRDNYICCRCLTKGGKLEAHHIKAWWLYPEDRFNIDNGITLCVQCHGKEYKTKKEDLKMKQFLEEQRNLLFNYSLCA